MADIMSIPSEIKFKEMLSHTFPGFFLASSLFMLIDYLSPDNLTSWAMGSLANLVIFGGFIIIIGTILGIIIDGIHHSFIEDDVFDNFKAIHILKMPIERKLKASNYDNFTRHFFFQKMGDKGANAIPLEEHFDQAYYRYSEFYSNIFISLVIFSVISPFYIFEILELTWKTSVGIGIASLLIACICLICSYTSYKIYLKAQSSAICGFIKGAESESVLTSGSEPKDSYEYNIYRFLVFIASLIPAIIIFVNLSHQLTSNIIWIALFIEFAIMLFDIFFMSGNIFQNNSELSREEINEENKPLENGEKVKSFLKNLSEENKAANDQIENTEKLMNELNKSRKELQKLKEDPRLRKKPNRDKQSEKISFSEELSKSSSAALLSFISSLLLCMFVLATAYTPINLNIEPTSIKFSENIANNTTLKNPVETITLRNLGDGLDDFSLSLNGIANNWLEIRYINDNGYLEDKSNNLSIASGESRFVQIKLNSSGMDIKNISQGSYIGSIDIDYSNRLKSIPLYINLTKK